MRSFIFNILYFSITFIYAFVALTFAQAGGTKTIRWFQLRHSRSMLWLARNVLLAKIEVRGLEKLRDRPPALLVSKHQSEMDPFAVITHFPDLGVIAMAELARYPLIGPVLRKLGHILVTVSGSRTNQTREVVEGARRVHEEGRPILIYPEATLMRVGSRERYRRGVFRIYDALQVEATPIAVSFGLVWPRRDWVKKPGGVVVIEYLDPIPPGLPEEAFMAEIERVIETRTMALIREHGDPDAVAEAERLHAGGFTNDDDGPRRPPIPSLTRPATTDETASGAVG